MLHAISARLARLAREMHSRLSTEADYASQYGWQARKIRPGTWSYRDPRFDARKRSAAASNGLVMLRDGRHF